MPYRIPGAAGKPYRPSNGSEGMMFAEQFCGRCKKSNGGEPCSIFDFAFWNDIGDEGYPQEWVHDANGEPACTAFERHD